MRKLTDIFKKISYPDGSFYVTIIDKTLFYESKYDTIKYSIQSYEDLFFLAYCKDVFDEHDVNTELLITHFFEQQADRRFHKEDSFGLKFICNFINKLNFNRVIVFHPHSDVTCALLNKSEVLCNNKFIEDVLKKIDTENLILMSTDAGGFKPLMKLVDEINWTGETYSASKSRQYVDGKSKLIQNVDKQDFGGKDVLLIDDLCIYGGTFIGLSKLLKERNCGKLFLAVSHITVQNPNIELENSFDKIFTTNSKYDSYDLNNLDIIDLF